MLSVSGDSIARAELSSSLERGLKRKIDFLLGDDGAFGSESDGAERFLPLSGIGMCAGLCAWPGLDDLVIWSDLSNDISKQLSNSGVYISAVDSAGVAAYESGGTVEAFGVVFD
jgi:hypothetical protein